MDYLLTDEEALKFIISNSKKEDELSKSKITMGNISDVTLYLNCGFEIKDVAASGRLI